MVFRPATPGFLVTLAATVCLALVSFGVPLLKSIYFLSATINHDSLNGTATFGVLGYCLQTGGNLACSNTTVGWEFDPNALLGLNLPLNIDIPEVVVKWLTYVLVLHIVGLGLAAVAAVFGLLAHVREMAMTCFSSCISGVAAPIVLLAFIFDLIFFFIIRSRIRAVGGVASLGNGLWLTLAAWVMLFFSGFFFGIGRCCFASRPRAPKGSNNNNKWFGGNTGADATGGIPHSEAMRLEAIKAEQDRKTRQTEVGLPAFPTSAEARPLNTKQDAQYYVEEDSEDEAKPYVPIGGVQRRGSAGTTTTAYTTNYAGRGRQQASQPQPQYPGGYMPGAQGTRTMDQYGNPAPSPGLQPGGPAAYRQPSATSNYGHNLSSSSPPPMPNAAQYLVPGAAVGEVFPGHGGRQSSYHSAVSHVTGQPSQFDQPYGGAGSDPYYTQQNQAPQQPQFPAAYPPAVAQQPFGDHQAGYGGGYGQTAAYDNNNAYQQQPQQPYVDPYAPTRTYTPPQHQAYPSQQAYPLTRQPTLPQVNTGVAGGYPNDPSHNYADPYGAAESRRSPTSPTGPRGPRSAGATVTPPWGQAGGSTADVINNYSSTPAPPPKDNYVPSDAPPSYDLPPGAAPPGAWPKEKR